MISLNLTAEQEETKNKIRDALIVALSEYVLYAHTDGRLVHIALAEALGSVERVAVAAGISEYFLQMQRHIAMTMTRYPEDHARYSGEDPPESVQLKLDPDRIKN